MLDILHFGELRQYNGKKTFLNRHSIEINSKDKLSQKNDNH